jgi:hypothetical protein
MIVKELIDLASFAPSSSPVHILIFDQQDGDVPCDVKVIAVELRAANMGQD